MILTFSRSYEGELAECLGFYGPPVHLQKEQIRQNGKKKRMR